MIDELNIVDLVNNKTNKSFYTLAEVRNYFADQKLFFFHSEVDFRFTYKILSKTYNIPLKTEYKFENFYELYEKYNLLTGNLLFNDIFLNSKYKFRNYFFDLDKNFFEKCSHYILNTNIDDKIIYYLESENKINNDNKNFINKYAKNIWIDKYNKFILQNYFNLNYLVIINKLISTKKIENELIKNCKLLIENNDINN